MVYGINYTLSGVVVRLHCQLGLMAVEFDPVFSDVIV
jgi:hypothetical protein